VSCGHPCPAQRHGRVPQDGAGAEPPQDHPAGAFPDTHREDDGQGLAALSHAHSEGPVADGAAAGKDGADHRPAGVQGRLVPEGGRKLAACGERERKVRGRGLQQPPGWVKGSDGEPDGFWKVCRTSGDGSRGHVDFWGIWGHLEGDWGSGGAVGGQVDIWVAMGTSGATLGGQTGCWLVWGTSAGDLGGHRHFWGVRGVAGEALGGQMDF